MKIENFQTYVKDFAPSIPADTYNADEVLAATEEVSIVSVAPPQGLRGAITRVSILDNDTTDSEISVLFFDQNVSIGTEGAAVTLADADAERCFLSWNSADTNGEPLGGNSIYKTSKTAYIHEPKYFHSTTGSIWVAIRHGTAGVVRTEDPIFLRIGMVIENIALA